MTNKKPFVVGLMGKAGWGKDTGAEEMMNACRPYHKVRTMGFADPLKLAAMALFDLTWEQVSDRVLKETPIPRLGNKTPRQLLQWLGSDVMRDQFDKEHWVNLMRHRLETTDADIVFITDIRFANEIPIVEEFGGVLVQVDASKRLAVPATASSGHISENGLGEIKAPFTVIDNNGTLDEYLASCREFIKKYI